MITCQRLILKTFNTIINLHPKTLTTITSCKFSSDDGRDKIYEVPFNFNRQQYRGYIKKVQKAKQEIAQVQSLQQGQTLPRRKRRVYDRPKHDTDLSGYAAWRIIHPEQTYLKLHEHSMDVVAKLYLQPKWVVHAFGRGMITVNNRKGTSKQYVFEDNNLSRYILYEYRNTTKYEKNVEGYDYENQQDVRPEMRLTKRLSTKDFWESQNQFEFRLNCTSYAEYLKFVKWVKQTIEERKTKESYDEVIDKKFGRATCFNVKEDMELFQPRSPFIMHVTPQSFELPKEEKSAGKNKKDKKGEKVEKTEPVAEQQTKTIKPAYNFAAQLDEQHRKEYKPQQKKVQINDL